MSRVDQLLSALAATRRPCASIEACETHGNAYGAAARSVVVNGVHAMDGRLNQRYAHDEGGMATTCVGVTQVFPGYENEMDSWWPWCDLTGNDHANEIGSFIRGMSREEPSDFMRFARGAHLPCTHTRPASHLRCAHSPCCLTDPSGA